MVSGIARGAIPPVGPLLVYSRSRTSSPPSCFPCLTSFTENTHKANAFFQLSERGGHQLKFVHIHHSCELLEHIGLKLEGSGYAAA
ncbi:hypothetical protein SAMN05216550_10423 [Paraburkholderia tropica]|uniref:Uncharacterized protein n=1 Tax=Paraburkholderia tropica TaxID=92647 RepID=A0AAQ1GD92_9BURK|nr:hypothetical protein SAMN05216550_10423 [Paraburkholderia tropica]